LGFAAKQWFEFYNEPALFLVQKRGNSAPLKMLVEAHVSMDLAGGDTCQSSNKRSHDKIEERSTCVKRLRLSDHTVPFVTTAPPCDDDDQVSASNDLQTLKSLQRLNSGHDCSLRYVEFRPQLVALIFDLGENRFKLLARTVHRSVNYLDRLLSKLPNIPHQHYNAFVAGCLLVAGILSQLFLH
jgi:hypothetical protein